MNCNSKRVVSGLFFVVFGLIYGAIAVASLPIGTARNMGPGYFPVVLAVILVLIGAYVLARRGQEIVDPIDWHLPWRPMLMIGAATVLFAVLFEPFGIFPSLFITTFIASLARRGAQRRESVLACAFIAALCSAIFGAFLKLPVAIVGPFFGPLNF